MSDAFLIALIGSCSILSCAVGLWLPSFRRHRAETRRLRDFVGDGEAHGSENAPRREASGGGVRGLLQREALRAKIDIAARDFALLMLLFASGTVALTFAITGRAHPAVGLVAGVCGASIPVLWVRWRASVLASRFTEQLPDTVTTLANGIRAGLTLQQAVSAVVRESADPTAGEFRPIERALGLGVALDSALDDLLRRRPSEDLSLLVSAMKLHALVGANLARVLDSIAVTLRERARIQRDVRVLTSQQRYSAYVLAGLPVIVGVALYLVSPDYFRVMFAYPLTRLALGLAATLVISGFLVMRRLASVDA